MSLVTLLIFLHFCLALQAQLPSAQGREDKHYTQSFRSDRRQLQSSAQSGVDGFLPPYNRTSYQFILSPQHRRQGVAHLGNGARLRAAVRKLLHGACEPVSIPLCSFSDFSACRRPAGGQQLKLATPPLARRPSRRTQARTSRWRPSAAASRRVTATERHSPLSDTCTTGCTTPSSRRAFGSTTARCRASPLPT